MDYPNLVLAAKMGDTGMLGKVCGVHMWSPTNKSHGSWCSVVGGWAHPNTELRGVSACWSWLFPGKGDLGLRNSQAECGVEAGRGGSSNVLPESPSCGREGGKMFSGLSFLVITWDCCFCLGNGGFSHSQ